MDMQATVENLQQMLVGSDTQPADPVQAVQDHLIALCQKNSKSGVPTQQDLIRFMAEFCTHLVEETIELTIEVEDLQQGAPSKIWVNGEEI